MSSRYSHVRRKVSSNFDQGFNNSMDELPDEVVWAILERMNTTEDKNSISLTCKRFYKLDNKHRKSIRLCLGRTVGSKVMLSLCKRFQNLQKVEIYCGNCEDLGDRYLYNLSISCPLLVDITLKSCYHITDIGLSHLASCSNLSALKLMYAHRITGRGMSAVVVGCRKLTAIHLFACSEIVGLDWLGGVEKLEELCIRRCTAIEQGDFIKLGPIWQTLKHLQFKRYRHNADNAHMNVEQWQSIPPCDNMLELILVRSSCRRGGLSSIMDKCRNLEKIVLDMCAGVEDSDIIALAQNSTNLRTISLRQPSYNHTRLTNESLKALALNCPRLESILIEFPRNNPPINNSLSLLGILDLVRMYPIRELTLKWVHSFGDAMQALRGAESLEMLELICCGEVRDALIQLAVVVPRLRVLKLTRCFGLSNEAFEPFRRRRKLEVLEVRNCDHLVSEEGVKGAADSVSFRK